MASLLCHSHCLSAPPAMITEIRLVRLTFGGTGRCAHHVGYDSGTRTRPSHLTYRGLRRRMRLHLKLAVTDAVPVLFAVLSLIITGFVRSVRSIPSAFILMS